MFRNAPGSAITTLYHPRAKFLDRFLCAPKTPGVIINCSLYDVLEHNLLCVMNVIRLVYINGNSLEAWRKI